MVIGKAVKSSIKINFKKMAPKNEGTITGFMPRVHIILSEYFGNSFITRGAPFMISLLLKTI